MFYLQLQVLKSYKIIINNFIKSASCKNIGFSEFYFDYLTVCMQLLFFFISIRSDRFSYSIRKFKLEKGGLYKKYNKNEIRK